MNKYLLAFWILMAVVTGAILQSVISQVQAQDALIKLQKDYGNQSSADGKRKALAEYVEKAENRWEPVLNLNFDFMKSFADEENIGLDEDGPTYDEWCEWLAEQHNSVAWKIFVASGCDL